MMIMVMMMYSRSCKILPPSRLAFAPQPWLGAVDTSHDLSGLPPPSAIHFVIMSACTTLFYLHGPLIALTGKGANL
eukprot:8114996-Lingulodinium_polyedra.AAC.1